MCFSSSAILKSLLSVVVAFPDQIKILKLWHLPERFNITLRHSHLAASTLIIILFCISLGRKQINLEASVIKTSSSSPEICRCIVVAS